MWKRVIGTNGIKKWTTTPSNTQKIVTTKVTDMKELFKNTTFNKDITDWDTSNVTNIFGMFWGASIFNQNLFYWDVGKINKSDWVNNNTTFAMVSVSDTHLTLPTKRIV